MAIIQLPALAGAFGDGGFVPSSMHFLVLLCGYALLSHWKRRTDIRYAGYWLTCAVALSILLWADILVPSWMESTTFGIGVLLPPFWWFLVRAKDLNERIDYAPNLVVLEVASVALAGVAIYGIFVDSSVRPTGFGEAWNQSEMLSLRDLGVPLTLALGLAMSKPHLERSAS